MQTPKKPSSVAQNMSKLPRITERYNQLKIREIVIKVLKTTPKPAANFFGAAGIILGSSFRN